jgi:hypothetical protein
VVDAGSSDVGGSDCEPLVYPPLLLHVIPCPYLQSSMTKASPPPPLASIMLITSSSEVGPTPAMQQ